MRIHRALAVISVIVDVFAFTAIGQQQSQPDNPQAQLEKCKAAMPGIMKNYNNAKYAVFLARQSAGGDHTGNYVETAQAALDSIEQPLKGCYEAFQHMKDAPPQEHSN